MPVTESLKRLNFLVEIIPPLLDQISEQDFDFKPQPLKWSKKEILGHLVDSAANNQQRFIRIQYENEPLIFYDQDKWNTLNGHADIPKKRLIEFWKIYNRHMIHIAERIPEESLHRKGTSKDGVPRTLAWYIQDYVVHMEHHLRQMVEYF
jgi:DinB superfamily